MQLKTEFHLAIQVLTPLHIGTGQVLQADYDYVVREERTLRIHEERFVQWLAERGEAFARLTQGVPPGKILGDKIPTELVRYALPGKPQGPKEIRECVKDAQDRPYLPGSSLKGALRTVLLWQAWKAQGLTLARVRLGPNGRSAARELEREIFGKTPQEDLLKALR
ncbi:MAG: RAMP superfamily CRISPR-associated protein, partial [Candidatus Bipolaricaulaceae bacterium]